MKELDKTYLEKCKALIAEKLSLGDITSWKQRDYENLSELIFEETKVSLSLSTLKRIFGTELRNLPQKSTLNALAKFIGFANWMDFIQKNPEIEITSYGKNNKLSSTLKPIFFLFSICILVLLGIFYYIGLFNGFLNRGSFPKETLVQEIYRDSLSGKKFTGLALTPPMGWNTWNTFGLEISEDLIKEMADLMIEKGMKDAGYTYLIIDDGWQASKRDKEGNLKADSIKFPSGMKALADYIHSKGLKIGLYSCAGELSCSGLPGGRGHEFQDARTFASWGIDYLKYAWCAHGTADALETYKIMRDALYEAERPVVYSICEWGNNQPWKWGEDVGHMWRTTSNITDCMDCNSVYEIGWKNILDRQIGLEKYAGPDHWNDPDMLEVGNPGLSLKESKTHFSMWCMLAAPLIAGNDLRKMSCEISDILNNELAIAINQDSLGKQAFRYSNENYLEIWIKELSNKDWAFCFLNSGKNEITKSINWNSFPMPDDTYSILDIWEKKILGTTSVKFDIQIRSNDVLFLKLSKVN